MEEGYADEAYRLPHERAENFKPERPRASDKIGRMFSAFPNAYGFVQDETKHAGAVKAARDGASTYIDSHFEILKILSADKMDALYSMSLFLKAQSVISAMFMVFEGDAASFGEHSESAARILKDPEIDLFSRAAFLELVTTETKRNERVNNAVYDAIADYARHKISSADFGRRIFEIYTAHIPHAGEAMTQLEVFFGSQAALLRERNNPEGIKAIEEQMFLKRAFTPSQVWSLLQMKACELWRILSVKTQQGFPKSFAVLQKVFGHSLIDDMAKMMLFVSIHENFSIVSYVHELVLNIGKFSREEFNAKVKEIFVANNIWGALALQEMKRRRELPTARAARLIADIENGAERKTFGRLLYRAESTGNKACRAKLEAIFKQAAIFVDEKDHERSRAIIETYIKQLFDSKKIDWLLIDAYNPVRDLSGQKAAGILSELIYDKEKDILGFMLPHERAAFERPLLRGDFKPDYSHPAGRHLANIAYSFSDRTIESNGELGLLSQYSWLLKQRVVTAAGEILVRALKGGIEEVEPAHMRALIRRASSDPHLHLTLLFWAARMANLRSADYAWLKNVPKDAFALMQEAYTNGGDLTGDVLQLAMRRSGLGVTVEREAVKYLSKKWRYIHLLPLDLELQGRRSVADIIATDEYGNQMMVEVKSAEGTSEEEILAKLDKAALQLISSRMLYPDAMPVIYLKVAKENFDPAKNIVMRWLRLAGRESPIAKIYITGDGREPLAIENPHLDYQTLKNYNAANSSYRNAEFLVSRLVRLGIIEPLHRDEAVLATLRAPTDAVLYVLETVPDRERLTGALKRHGVWEKLEKFGVDEARSSGIVISNDATEAGGVSDEALAALADEGVESELDPTWQSAQVFTASRSSGLMR